MRRNRANLLHLCNLQLKISVQHSIPRKAGTITCGLNRLTRLTENTEYDL